MAYVRTNSSTTDTCLTSFVWPFLRLIFLIIPPSLKHTHTHTHTNTHRSSNETTPSPDIRISNRLVGDYVMTANNIAAPRAKEDSIGVGDWSFDEHMTGKYAVPDGKGNYNVTLEGNFWPSLPNNTNWCVNVCFGDMNVREAFKMRWW